MKAQRIIDFILDAVPIGFGVAAVVLYFALTGCNVESETVQDARETADAVLPTPDLSTTQQTTAPQDDTPEPFETRIISEIPEALTIRSIENKTLEEFDTVFIEPAVFFESDAMIRSAVVASEDTLFFGNENNEFFAVDILTGEVLWIYAADEAIQTTPVIAHDRILFNAGNSLYILDMETGTELFKITSRSSSTRRVSDTSYAFNDSYAAVYEDVAYYPTLDGEIVAVDMLKGEVIWSIDGEVSGNITSGINYYDGKIYYVNNKGNLCCIDTQSQRLLFQVELGDRVYAPMTIDDGMIYLGGRSCKTYCIDVNSGDVIWSSHSYDETTWFSGGSVVIGSTVYACTSDEKTIIAFDKHTGEFKRLYPTGTNAYTKPALYGDNIIVAATDVYSFDNSIIMEFDTESHTMLWEAHIEDCVLSAPAVYDGVLYFGSDSGKIYSIDLE